MWHAVDYIGAGVGQLDGVLIAGSVEEVLAGDGVGVDSGLPSIDQREEKVS